MVRKQHDVPQVTLAPGEQPSWSECCLAAVTNVVEPTHDTEDYHSSHFVCAACGEQCAIETSARIVEYRRQLEGNAGD